MRGITNTSLQLPQQLRRSVDKLIPHENFMPALYENDICLIRMDSPIVYTPSLLPVCLPSPHIAESDDYARY